MLFIEAPIFTSIVNDYLNDAEYAALQWKLAIHPDSGDVIRSSGGIRKLRWPRKGKGKRGGLRVIYYWYTGQHEIWMLTIYAKSELVDLPKQTLRVLRKEIQLWLKKEI